MAGLNLFNGGSDDMLETTTFVYIVHIHKSVILLPPVLLYHSRECYG